MAKVHETVKFVKHWRVVPDDCYEFEGLEQNSRHLNSMQLYIYRNRAACTFVVTKIFLAMWLLKVLSVGEKLFPTFYIL